MAAKVFELNDELLNKHDQHRQLGNCGSRKFVCASFVKRKENGSSQGEMRKCPLMVSAAAATVKVLREFYTQYV